MGHGMSKYQQLNSYIKDILSWSCYLVNHCDKILYLKYKLIYIQTLKKAQTRGQCQQIFLRIVEIFGLGKIVYFISFKNRPDENQLLHDGLLAYTCKVDHFIKFFTATTYWSIQATKLHIPDLLDDVDPPQALVHDLVVLKPSSGIEVGFCMEICKEEDISQV